MRRISAVQGKLIDANVWIAVSFEGHDYHQQALQFLTRETSLASPALLCRATEQSWLRLLTTPALHRRYDSPPVSNRDALNILSDTLELPNVRMIEDEPTGVRALWHRLASLSSASPKVWMDAYLAAFAISHGVEFVTLDSDFNAYVQDGLKLILLSP
ncbi:MAG: TA system VapC family ribonuclease toxin [Verrucomicrobiota bacterium]